MAQNLSNFDEALKIDYLPVIREQLNHETVLLDKVQRNERDVSGKQWQLVAHYQRNSGIGAGAETGLPTAGNQQYENPYESVKYNRGRIQVSGPVMKASKNDKGAIVRALDSEIKGVTRDLRKEVNYQLFNDGTAVRALVNGDPATGTTLTVDNPGTQYLFEGQKIDILDPSAGTANDDSVVISSVDSSTQVTVSAALDTDISNNDEITMEDATDQSGTSYEMMGLKGIVDDGTEVTTLHNLSRNSYNWWKCSTHSNDDNSGTNRDLTLDLIQDSVTAVEKNGGKVDMILSDHDLRDSYASLVVSDKRHVNTMELDGGWKALEYNGIPWVADVDAPPNTVFFIDLDHLYLMQMADWDWMDKNLCSSKIWLYAGKSNCYYLTKHGGANDAKIQSYRQSAGKLNQWVGRYNRRRWFFLNSQEERKGKSKTVLLSRFPTSKHESDNYRQGSKYNQRNLWLSYFGKTTKKQTLPLTVETKNFGVQKKSKISSGYNPLSSRKKGGGTVSTKVCSHKRSKQRRETGENEKTFKFIEESSETIRQTVQNTEDIVRTSWGHEELGRNVQALAYC